MALLNEKNLAGEAAKRARFHADRPEREELRMGF